MDSPLARVYIVVSDASGAVVARRYLARGEIASWLTIRAGAESTRCDVYDEAPECGGRVLTTFVPRGKTWVEIV